MAASLRLGDADLAVLALYLGAIVWLGLRAASRRRSGAEDYILAGRSLTLPSFVATLVPSFFGGTLGVGEYAYRFGISNWLAQGVPYYAFSVLYAVFLARRVRATPGMTIPDHIETAYGKPAAVLAAILVFLLASPADEALMLGTLTRWITGWPMAACLCLTTAACTAFLFAGGLRSDVWANRLEFLVMFGGFSLLLPFAVLSSGGPDFLAGALPAAHLHWHGGQGPWKMLAWAFIALWTFVDPAFHQRVCAARDARTAARGIGVSVGFWCLFDFLTTSTGLYARAILPGLEDPLQSYPALAERLLPPVLRGLFLAGVASSTLAAMGTTSFLAAVSVARDAVGRLWPADEAVQESRIRAALLATSVLSVLVALALPSVVGIWYTVGSTVIPGLLIPLVSAYFKPLRVPPWAGLLSSMGGWLGASAAWACGAAAPFYAGLTVSALFWAAGKAFPSIFRGPAPR